MTTQPTGNRKPPGYRRVTRRTACWFTEYLEPDAAWLRRSRCTQDDVGLSTVRGAFGELAGSAEILPGGAGRGRLEIGAASLNTKNASGTSTWRRRTSSTPPTTRRSWPTWPARPGPVTAWPSRAR
jgi:hypothetical protein